MEEIYDEFIKTVANGFLEARKENTGLDVETYISSALEFLANSGSDSQYFLVSLIDYVLGLHEVDPISSEDGDFTKSMKFVLAGHQLKYDVLKVVAEKVRKGEAWIAFTH